MTHAELAARLVAAGESERLSLLRQHSPPPDAPLARALLNICRELWNSDPAQVIAAADLLENLAESGSDEEIKALAAWGLGIAALAKSQMESARALLDEGAEIFYRLNQPHAAASTQISKLMALSVLGRYDEAVECGLQARAVFEEQGDALNAARIDHNIGNLYWRRDLYPEAEAYLEAARQRYLSVNDEKRLASVEYGLAYLNTLRHRFQAAEELYDLARQHAENTNLEATQADIEVGLGTLALVRGQYGQALDLLEQARRRYAALEMPYQSAITEQEIADAYMELNLVPEAVALYERLEPELARLGARGERARALEYLGRAMIQQGDAARAHRCLNESRSLYLAEGSAVGAAMVTLTEAQMYHAEKSYELAANAAEAAAKPLAEAGAWRRWLIARWLHGDAARAQGDPAAQDILEQTLRDAEAQEQPNIAYRCHTSLGLLAMAAGRFRLAEASFQRAVRLIETLRAPLPAEEFRAAFFADKLAPYEQLARLCLDTGRVAEALAHVEKSRARALQDLMSGAPVSTPEARDDFERQTLARLQELRQELNWLYSRINRPTDADAAALAALHQAVREREHATLELMRQLEHRGRSVTQPAGQFDLAQLQAALGRETALLEYAFLDGECLALVVTDAGVEAARGLGSEAELQAAVEQFHFQINGLRHGAAALRRHLPQLAARARRHLGELYDLLVRPVETLVGARRLVVVPQRALHYVPFHALHDGANYLIEGREISYAPSAGVLLHCLAQPVKPLDKAALFGMPDELAPRVSDEIGTLAPLFAEAVTRLGAEASLESLCRDAPAADVLHLACHGQFRPDNPLFSALKLGDGWLTVRDAAQMRLQAGLVTLSACETGVNAVAPGDELLGLARGFFAAGAPSLLLSLWTVDDESTAALMADFYRRLRAGHTLAAALRAAQRHALAQHEHPFFWSPFVLVGRW
jgi:CHAT domain-containing protein